MAPAPRCVPLDVCAAAPCKPVGLDAACSEDVTVTVLICAKLDLRKSVDVIQILWLDRKYLEVVALSNAVVVVDDVLRSRVSSLLCHAGDSPSTKTNCVK